MIAWKFLPFRPTATAAAANALRPHHHHRLRCYSSSNSSDSDTKPASEDSKTLETAATATATAKLEAAQTAIGYRFRKLELLQEALQAAGSGLGPPFVPGGNKQLALVGDRLLSFRLALLGRELGERTGKFCADPGCVSYLDLFPLSSSSFLFLFLFRFLDDYSLPTYLPTCHTIIIPQVAPRYFIK